MKKLAFVAVIFTLGQLSALIRTNIMANSVAKRAGNRPVIKEPKTLWDLLEVNMTAPKACPTSSTDTP